MSRRLFRSGWITHAVATLSVFGALGITLGSTVPATFATIVAVGISAIVVSVAVVRQTAPMEFVTSIAIPVLGLLVVLTPAVTIVETYGVTFSLEELLIGTALGVTAGAAGAIVFPLAVGAFRPALSSRVYGTSGQLLVPLSAAVLFVFVLDQLRILELVPPPLELYAFFTVEPAQSSETAALFITSTFSAVAVGYLGFLLGRPLAFGFVYPTERDGRLLKLLVRFCYRFALAILAVCWSVALLLLFEAQVSYPEGIWLLIDTTTAVVTNPTITRLAVNTLLAGIALTVLASPLYAIRWVERTGTLWIVRLVFSGALAVSIGLVVAYLLQQGILQSEAAMATVDGTPGGWAAFEWLPVIVTAIPLLGTAILFGSSLFYVWFFERGRDAYSLFITYRNVGVGAVFFSVVFAQAIGAPMILALAGATLAVIAWDCFEYAQTARTELPTLHGFSVPEVVHSTALVAILAGGVGLTVAVDRWLTPLVTPQDGTLIAVFVLLLGLIGLLFALRE